MNPMNKSKHIGCVTLATFLLSTSSFNPALSASDGKAPFNITSESGDQIAPTIEQKPEAPKLQSEKQEPDEDSWRRNLIPFNALTLNGERDSKSWSFVLTAEEARAPAQFNIAYQNAILVAPESSTLTVKINDVVVLNKQIQSAEKFSKLEVPLPSNLLHEGSNSITFNVEQRHRTDCSVASTYELWTNIDPGLTNIVFDLPAPSKGDPVKSIFHSVNDIAAIGVDAKGQTNINLIVPSLVENSDAASLLNLTQSLALLASMPNLTFSVNRSVIVEERKKEPQQSGSLSVLVGTKSELASTFEKLGIKIDEFKFDKPQFVYSPVKNERVFVVSGNTRDQLNNAINEIQSSAPVSVQPELRFNTKNWLLPETPMLQPNSSLNFSQLGVETQQSSGRRVKNSFTVGLPADFYANAIGRATILLDAAYSADVQPGSHIDVFVNGEIATTIPIFEKNGGVFKQTPVNIGMSHFRAGINTIEIETILKTSEDEVCNAGMSSSNTPRFALFSTSKFKMPSYGRIGQTPNLSATINLAFPYRLSSGPVPLLADLQDFNVLSSAASITGKLAVAGGKLINYQTTQSTADLDVGNALIVGAISDLPAEVLSKTGINPEARTDWSDDDVAPLTNEKGPDRKQLHSLDDWSKQTELGWSNRIADFLKGIQTTFKLSAEALRLLPSNDSSFLPNSEISLIVAQGTAPHQNGVWTVFTAPNSVELHKGVDAVSKQENWVQAKEQLVGYDLKNNKVQTIPAHNLKYLVTQPLSIWNVRLIATNWLSSNSLLYVIFFVCSLLVLGFSTSHLVKTSGRRSDDE